jgi:hypothetical protein
VKNAGAYVDWTAADPFTTGDFAGFWAFAGSGVGGNTTLSTYESPYGVIVQLGNATAALRSSFWFSVDPYSTDSATSEDDGLLDVICGTSDSGSLNTEWLSGGNGLFNEGSGYHGKIMVPGGSTMVVTRIAGQAPSSQPTTTSYLNAAGEYTFMPVVVQRTDSNRVVGPVHNVYWGIDSTAGTPLTINSVVRGFFVSLDRDTTQDTLFLPKA